MKHLRHLFLLALIALFSSCMTPCSPSVLKGQYVLMPETNYEYYFIPESSSAEVISYNPEEKEIVIPETVAYDGKTYNVEAMWGYYYGSVTSITVPNSIRIMSETTFSNCPSLNSITIPKNIAILKGFRFCKNLRNIHYLSGIDSLMTIDKYAFKQSKFPVCVIPDNVISIGYAAFSICKNLHTITIPTSVKKIEKFAFYRCLSLATIYYLGTKEQWEQVEKEDDWCKGTKKIIVKCVDSEFVIQ